MSRGERRREQRAQGKAAGSRGSSAAPQRALLERLLDLAHDASTYLRLSPQPAVRVSAALLLAASLAACSGGEAPPTDETTEAVQPLSQEVRHGLPTKPGRYPIVQDSLARDQQGVYRFSWKDPSRADDPGTPATASLIRLLYSGEDVLEIPGSGDPVLHLRRETPVALISSAGDVRETRTTIYRSYGGPSWYPFYLITSPHTSPAYYDPPRNISSSGPVRDSVVSSAPRPAAERTVGLSGAVSGRAGGTGAGTAVSQRTGSLGGKSGAADAAGAGAVGGKSSVGSAKSSGFSSGGGSSSSGSSS